MAILTDADVADLYRQLYRKGEGKEEIKADGLLSPTVIKAVFQAIEDWYEGERATVKAAIVAAAGRPMSNAAAKKFGRVWMRRKWRQE